MTTKNHSSWLLLYKQWLSKCYNVYQDYIKFNTEQAENTKSAEKQKNKLEDTDLYKPVLNKLGTKQE